MKGNTIKKAALVVALSAVTGCANLTLNGHDNSAPITPINGDNTPERWFQQGNRHAERGELEQAEQAYQQALELGPHPRALHNLGLVRLRLGMLNIRDALGELPPEHLAQRQTRDFVRLLLRSPL